MKKYRAGQASFNMATFIVLLLAFILFTVTFGHLASQISKGAVIQFDKTIIEAAQGNITDISTKLLTVITELGSVKGNIMIVVILFGLFLFYKHFWSGFFLVFTTLSGGFVNKYLKWIFQRERPTINPLIEVNGYSFPSGHAMSSFVLYGALMIIVTRLTKRWSIRLIIYLLSSTMIILIGFSRIYLGVHYPSDVIAGYAAGGLWILIIASAFHYAEYRRINRN